MQVSRICNQNASRRQFIPNTAPCVSWLIEDGDPGSSHSSRHSLLRALFRMHDMVPGRRRVWWPGRYGLAGWLDSFCRVGRHMSRFQRLWQQVCLLDRW